MPTCFAYGCHVRRDNLPPGVSFHRFPRDIQQCTRWVVNCGVDVGNIGRFVKESVSMSKPRHFLCSKHFTENQFQLDYKSELLPEHMKPRRPVRQLLKDAVPTLFIFTTTHPRTSSEQRLQRKQRENVRR